jgi:hypothetical protein
LFSLGTVIFLSVAGSLTLTAPTNSPSPSPPLLHYLDDDASTGSEGVIPSLGVGQALVTLALVLAIISAAMGFVYYRHRREGVEAPFNFSFSSILPSRRGRTHGSGVVGGGGGDERNERLLGAGGANDSNASDYALRNRPGGHSLI